MNESCNNRYLKFIAYLQVMGIILVVLGHSLHEYPDGATGHTLWLYRIIYNVHMPIFTFVSGYLMYFTSLAVGRTPLAVSAFTLGKIKRLLIPYIVLTLVTFIPRAFMSAMADDVIEPSFRSLYESLFYSHRMVIPYFWFLQTIFLLLVINFIVLKLFNTKLWHRDIAIWFLTGVYAVLPFTGLSFSTFLSINDVVWHGFYFMLGIVYCRYAPVIDRHLHTSSITTALVSGIAWIVFYFMLEHTCFARIVSLLGICTFLTVAHILENRNITVLDHLMGANYIIFLLSWYLNVASQQILAHYVDLPWWIHTLLSLIAGIYVPWVAYVYLSKHQRSRWVRAASFLLGQKIKNRR